MLEGYGLSLLRDLIVGHDCLEPEDKCVIENLCRRVAVPSKTTLINTLIRRQVEDEATVTYLVGKYSSMYDRYMIKFDKYRAEKSVNLGDRTAEDLKWTKAGKEQFLLTFDAEYRTLHDTTKRIWRLLEILKQLSVIVMNKDRKLEQLSVNYRRETEVDRRTSG